MLCVLVYTTTVILSVIFPGVVAFACNFPCSNMSEFYYENIQCLKYV
ncbi:hypothetical protein GCM10025859_58880 [Alicyclobacillus fastidiosus]|nr:hypothetical protein GCM10025859_58880 [Alicyclobacillus fastidiosus]